MNRGVVRIGLTHVDVLAKKGTNEHKTVHKPMPHKQWMALIEGGKETSTKVGSGDGCCGGVDGCSVCESKNNELWRADCCVT
jgi:hypothetical protein